MKIRTSRHRTILTTNPFVSEAQRRACYAKDDPDWDCKEWESHTPKGKKLPKRKAASSNKSKGSKSKSKAVRNAARRDNQRRKKRLSRIDPTRTATIRRHFLTQLRRRFALLKGRIVRFIGTEDAFGLKERQQIRNAFCPTGEGGGIDPSCSSGVGVAGAARFKVMIPKNKDVFKLSDAIREQNKNNLSDPGVQEAEAAILSRGTKKVVLMDGSLVRGAVSILPRDNGYIAIDHMGAIGKISGVGRELMGHVAAEAVKQDAGVQLSSSDLAYGFYQKMGYHNTGNNNYEISAGEAKALNDRLSKSNVSPTPSAPRSEKLSKKDLFWVKAYENGGMDRADAIKAAIALRNTATVVNAAWEFNNDPDKIVAFQQWLKQQLAELIVGRTEEELWKRYIQRGYQKGAGRAFDDARAAERAVAEGTNDQRKLDFYAGTREEFLRSAFAQPESVEKVQLLAGRSFDDLENVTADMSARMSRALVDGLIEGKGPMEVAGDLTDVLDISRPRAETIARTELIRAHAEGQLDAMERLGVEEVGVAVEWSTAGDNAVCELCQPMEGVVLTIDEARNMIPMHPNCRCAFIPANVGEDDDEQKRTKKEIEDALGEAGLEDVEIDRNRPQSVLNELIEGGVSLPSAVIDEFSQWVVSNSFCPTGVGGGVDPSCTGKAGGSGKIVKEKSSWRSWKSSTPLGLPTKSVSETTGRSVFQGKLAAKVAELSGKSPYGVVKLEDLHDALGRPPIAEMREHVRSMWRAGAISVEEHEGREQVTQRQLETAMMVKSSRTGGLDSRITSIYVTDRSKLRSLVDNERSSFPDR